MSLKRLSFPEWAVVLLFLLIAGLLGLVVRDYLHLKERVVAIAFENAKTISTISSSAHKQYSASVKGLAGLPGINFTTDTSPEARNVHFPATFSQELSKRIRKNNEQTRMLIYSNHPFDSQKGRALDVFQLEALAFLDDGTQKAFRGIRNVADGTRTLRLAQPMVMVDSCVACHNDAKWGLSKQDWKVGEVRGVREVEVAIPEMNAHGLRSVLAIFVMSSIALAMTGFMVYPIVRREVTQRDRLQAMSGEMETQRKFLTHQAFTDPLTTLGNRRFFDEASKEYIREFQAISKPLSMIVFDIDHFKAVNDTYGHNVGDQVIAGFAKCIQKNTRTHDVSARIGGEEFAIIIPLTDRKATIAIAERIRVQASQLQFEGKISGDHFSITVSGGISMMDVSDSAESLYQKADDNLYHSKRRGRNQISIWETRAA